MVDFQGVREISRGLLALLAVGWIEEDGNSTA
jgi:hypothetical protein